MSTLTFGLVQNDERNQQWSVLLLLQLTLTL
jgi:hypothetical protein